ncbi:hypothetical protein LAT59_03640 [Candidatus Gracilibacteria bacterium]|nr:hypothetical protein [Candidatus Gracilibacteria bacterium]
MSKKIYLIDGNSFIYRMFFALPEFATSSGKIVNATFGMAKFFVGQLVKEKPDYIVFIKDAKGENFRHKLYSEYKATRERMPDNLRTQIADIEAMIAAMNIDIVEIDGYEADDVIATLAMRLGIESQNEIYILSGDKDLFALVAEQVRIYDTQKKKIYGPDETYEKFGVSAACVRDYLAICGDTSDNIPGISGIGPKKAQALLNGLCSLEKLYEIVDNYETTDISVYSEELQKTLKGASLKKLQEGRELAFLSQKLATLECDVPLPGFDLANYSFKPSDIFTPELEIFFKENEFFSLLESQEEDFETWEKLGKQVQIIGDNDGLSELSDKIFSGKYTELVLDTETTSLNPREAELCGVSILLSEDDIYYINLMHRGPQVSYTLLQDFISKLFASDILLIGHNIKYDIQVLEMFLASTGHSGSTKNPQAPKAKQASLFEV